MNRWLYYAAGAYFVPNRIASAVITGLAIADIAYNTQTTLLHVTPMVALGTTAVVFKVVSIASYLLV